VGGVIYTPRPHSRVRPFSSRVHPPPLQHAPVRARARSRTRPRPDTCPHRNGCARIAFRPRKDIVFAPGPTRLRPLTCVCARRVCAHNRGRAKSLRPVPRVRAWSPRPFLPVRARRVCARIRGRAKSPCPVPRVRASSSRSFPPVRARSHSPAPGPTRPRPLARVRVQRGRTFTSGRTRATARATNARPQSFPTGAPCSRVRPQQYINPFAPPHKSLCF
jgi:hypothetical protein